MKFGDTYKDPKKYIEEGKRDEKNIEIFKEMTNKALENIERKLKHETITPDEYNKKFNQIINDYTLARQGIKAKEQTALEKANRTTMLQNAKKRKTTHGGSKKTKKRKSKSKKRKTRK